MINEAPLPIRAAAYIVWIRYSGQIIAHKNEISQALEANINHRGNNLPQRQQSYSFQELSTFAWLPAQSE